MFWSPRADDLSHTPIRHESRIIEKLITITKIIIVKSDKIQANKTLKAATRIRTRLAEVNPKQRKIIIIIIIIFNDTVKAKVGPWVKIKQKK